MNHDPRLTPVRSDVAAEHLRGLVEAPRYVPGAAHMVAAPRTPLLRAPDGGIDTELLHGEGFTVYDTASGWAWGQSALDGYVGYVEIRDLMAPGPEPTHRVVTLSAQTYERPELKLAPMGRLPFGARVHVAGSTDSHAQVGPSEWVPLPQLSLLASAARDWVSLAEMFLGVPYVWGGRSSDGVDCSGLVQLTLQAANRSCPRDSGQQHAALGRTLDTGEPLQRGDLIFWKGHVGIMRDPLMLLHANAHHMAVATEPLAQAVRRIEAKEFGKVVRRARLDPEAPAA